MSPVGGAAEDGVLSVIKNAVSFSNAFNIVCAPLTVTRSGPSRRVFVVTQRRKSDWPRLRWDLRQSDLHRRYGRSALADVRFKDDPAARRVMRFLILLQIT